MTGWRETTLGEVVTLINGDRGRNYPSAEYRTGAGIPFVNAGLLINGRVRPEGDNFISRERFDLLRSGHVEAGDVVLCIRGSIGRVALVTPDVVPSAIASSLVILRPGPDINPRFLLALLQAPVGQQQIIASDNGVAQPNLGAGEVGRFRFRMPTRRAQQRIAEVLGPIDDLIENNQRRVEVLEEMARAIYREWFVRFRYPGHEDVALVDSPLGPIPVGWHVQPLFDAADVLFGFSFKSKRFAEVGPFPVIRIRDVPSGRTKTFSDERPAERCRVVDGDVLVGMDGDFHLQQWTGGAAWLNQRVARLRPRGELSGRHLLLAIAGPIKEWNSTIVGTTVAHLGKRHLEQIRVVLPPRGLLRQASAVLGDTAEQVRTLVQASRRLAGIRDLLLPKLVTGQIDVAALDLDALVEGSVA